MPQSGYFDSPPHLPPPCNYAGLDMSEHAAVDPFNELNKKNRHSRLPWQQLIAWPRWATANTVI